MDGQAELQSLPQLLVQCESRYELLQKVLYADLQPLAPPGQVASVAMTRVPMFRQMKINLLVVLIDHERQPECAGDRAKALEDALNQRLRASGAKFRSKVIMKHRCLENWLVADIDALRCQPRLFRSIDELVAKVEPDKADHVDADRLLRRVLRRSYSKPAVAVTIMGKANPYRIARHSRSFRRFLRVLGNPRYAKQSKYP